MARQVLPVVGAVIGGYFGGAAGAQWGWAIGSAVGNAIDPQIIQGPKIGDLAQQTSQEGVPRPIVFGVSPPIAGNIIDTSEPRIVKSTSGGGKGGPKVKTESVFRTYAIRVCEGPIFGFVRVWRNGILVYDARLGSTPDNAKFLETARFFLGDFTQNPSPDLEAIHGVGTTPPYRGTAYMVMADEDLTDLRGSIPQYAFQVTQGGSLDCETITAYSNEFLGRWPSGGTSMQDPRGGIGCNTYEYRFDTGDSTAYPGGVEGTFEAACANAETVGGIPFDIPDTTIRGWNRRSDNQEGIYPYNSVLATTTLDLRRWLYVNQVVPTFVSNAIWDNSGTGDPFHVFMDNNNLDGAWWSGRELIGQGGHGVLQFTVYPSSTTVPDSAIEVRLVPHAPYTECDTCGGALLPSGIEGYCVDEDGHYFQIVPWTLEAINYHVLSKTVVSGTPGTYSSVPLNPARPTGHIEFNDQPFWEAAYADAVTAGDLPPGLVYGVDYPATQTFGYTRTYDSCELSAETVPLADVVTSICNRAGLTQIDVTLLTADVRGFVVTNAYPAFAALQALSQIFLFDPTNFDGIIHFVPRGANSVATITEDNMLDDDEQIEQDRRSDSISIPRVLNLNYYDIDGGLSTDKQTSERAGDRRSLGDMSIQTTILMNADEAARAVHINHKVLIEDQKGELRFSLPDKFLSLTAANPIIVQYQGRSQRVRVSQCNVCDGYQEYTCIRDRQSAYTSNVEGIPAAPQTPPPSGVVGATLIEPLDIHILRDVDDSLGLGYYMAITGLLPAWQGALVELSLDGGANYLQSSTWNIAAVMGETLTIMGDHPQGYPDIINAVSVVINTPDGALETTDLEGLLNRQNLAIIGNEILQFGTADETTSGEWDLSYFIRGRKGTQPTDHFIGERFVLLDRNAIPFIPADLTQLGQTLTFRATSFGTPVSSGTVVSMAFIGRTQIELEPAYLAAHIDGTDAVVSWQGVGRLGAGVNVAQGAYFIGYRVTFNDGSLTEIVDTLSQDLTHDVSSFSLPLHISVGQRNQLTGLGPEIEVTLT